MMAADLSTMPHTGINVQLCGDAHVRNVGAYGGLDGRLVFDINDFDAGAQTPGRLLRFLRITVQGAEPKRLELRRFHIWAKQGK